MISLEEAYHLIREKVPGPGGSEARELSEVLGFALAEEIRMDEDAPPFDKSMMDGFAVRAQDCTKASARLRVIGESRAGLPFSGSVGPGETAAILTGAPLPQGADSVIQVEKTNPPSPTTALARSGYGESSFVEILEPVEPGKNIARKGEDAKKGDLVLREGIKIRPQEISVLAAVGKAKVKVFPKPRVSIVASGDELVPVDRRPSFGQIRESNSFGLEGQVLRLGFPARRFGIAPDEPGGLREALKPALEEGDCLVVSGGISVGRYDYVEEIFEKLGIVRHFHGVKVKPGKPVWFGTFEGKIVFGLPGNPVSSFVIFEAFVRPALEKMAGLPFSNSKCRGKFLGGRIFKNPRVQFLPSVVRQGDQGAQLEALPWTSAGDFLELTKATALLIVPPQTVPETGSIVEFLPI